MRFKRNVLQSGQRHCNRRRRLIVIDTKAKYQLDLARNLNIIDFQFNGTTPAHTLTLTLTWSHTTYKNID